MPRHTRWTSSLVVLVALAGCAASAKRADGAPISYHTQGDIWPWTYGKGGIPGYNGTNAISFQGVTNGTITVGSPFPLGEFVISTLPTGSSTTYHDSAFSITLDTSLGDSPVPLQPGYVPYSSLSVNGVLNGTVTGAGPSDITAKVLSITPNFPISFPEQPINPILDLPFPLSALTVEQPVVLSSSTSAAVRTTIFARVDAVPEPAPAITFLIVLAGLGLRARARCICRRVARSEEAL